MISKAKKDQKHHEFQSQKGKKNKYNMFEWWIKRSQHLTTNFTKNLAKTLIGYDKKVDFFIQLLDHIEFWIILYNIFSP